MRFLVLLHETWCYFHTSIRRHASCISAGDASRTRNLCEYTHACSLQPPLCAHPTAHKAASAQLLPAVLPPRRVRAGAEEGVRGPAAGLALAAGREREVR